MKNVTPVYVAGNRTVHAGRKVGTYSSGAARYAKLCSSAGSDRHDPAPAEGREVTCKRCLAKIAPDVSTPDVATPAQRRIEKASGVKPAHAGKIVRVPRLPAEPTEAVPPTTYHVDVYEPRSGTTNHKHTRIINTGVEVRAIEHARAASGDYPGALIVVVRRDADGGKHVHVAYRDGKKVSKSTTTKHTNDTQEHTMTTDTNTTTETTNDKPFTAHVWIGGKVKGKRSYSTLKGAIAFADKQSATAAVKEVTVLDADGNRWVSKNGSTPIATTVETEPAAEPVAETKPEPAKKAPAKPAGKARYTGAPLPNATWGDLLRYTDNLIDATYKQGRTALPLPTSMDTTKLSDFETAYAEYLRGNRKGNPSGPAFKLDAPVARASRIAVRKRIAKAADVKLDKGAEAGMRVSAVRALLNPEAAAA
jgi:hypothetical protein